MSDPTRPKSDTSRGSDHDNAFDLLRLVFALFVVYTHGFFLTGQTDDPFAVFAKNQTGLGTMGVLGFFGISGFLVTRSFHQRNNWKHFVYSRALRILPGFYLSLVLSAFFFSPLVAFLLGNFVSWNIQDAASFIFDNLFVRIRCWSVGTTLSGLPYSGSINGALWSLFPEVLCYGLVLVFGLLGFLQRQRYHVFLFSAFALVIHIVLSWNDPSATPLLLAPTFLHLTGWTPFLVSFMTGSLLFLFRDRLHFEVRGAILWIIGAIILLRFGGWNLLGPVVLPLAVIHAAFIGKFRLPVDLSYGIYIFHFPVQQLLATTSLKAFHPFVFIATASIISALVALASWLLVEKPALDRKPRGISS